jgi:hypothetical protein
VCHGPTTRNAKCLDGRQNVANRRIEDLLREYEGDPFPLSRPLATASRGLVVAE